VKTLCNNGNSVERFYDRRSRSSVTRTLDPSGNQIGDAQFDGNKISASFSWCGLVRENGGPVVKTKKKAGL
jgi:hypothetical protein